MERYEKYKDSGIEWIGEIPENWEVKRLKRFAKICNGQDHKSVYDLSGDYPILGSGGEFGRANQYLHKGPSVLLGRKGTIDKPQYVDFPFWSVDTAYYTDIFPKTDPRFFYYLCTNIQFDLYKYGSAVPSMNQDTLSQIEFPSPSYDEQSIIATYLDRKTAEIDHIIANKQKLIALYEEEKQAIINQAVTKGLDPNVKMKDSGVEWLGEIPEHWEVKRFNFIFSFSRGLPITKENLKDEGIPCISYGEIHSKYGFEVNPEKDYLKCVDDGYLITSEKSLLKRGDFVFADTSEDIPGSGNFTYLNSDTPVFAGYHTIIAVPKVEFITRFVAYFFDSTQYRNQIRCSVTGTKVYSITQSILKNTNVILPPIQEQTLIVEYINKEFSRLETIISKFNKQIDLLQEYRTTLISEVVTGKVKVRG